MFLGLEPGVTYNIQIKACDIYENRSDWSTVENQITATDEGTPAQIAGETATAIVTGIKVEWIKGAENNIDYYLVERQESPDNTDWTGAWTERARIDGDMWLDLLLTYSKYYRYRITAYTVAGVAGVTSAFTTALQPNQVGENDVAADAITALKIDVIDLSVINEDVGHITAGDITLDADGYIKTVGKDSYADTTAGFWLGYDGAYKFNVGNATDYLKWNGSNLSIHGSVTITGGSGIANLTDAGALATADDYAYADLTGTTPPTDADHTADIVSAMAYESLVEAAKLGTTIISGGYKFGIGDSTHYMQWNGSTLTIKGITTTDTLSAISANVGELIIGSTYGGEIHSYGKDSPTDTTAGFWLGYSSGYKFNIGNGSTTAGTGNCMIWDGSSLTVRGSLKVGGGSNEDITFEDSGIRMYDHGSNVIAFDKTSYERLQFNIYGNAVQVGGDTSCAHITFYNTGQTQIWCISKAFNFYKTGTLQLPVLGSTAPTAHAGDIAIQNSASGDTGNRMHYYSSTDGWQRLADTNGW